MAINIVWYRVDKILLSNWLDFFINKIPIAQSFLSNLFLTPPRQYNIIN